MEYQIHQLPFPAHLVHLMKTGRWRTPLDRSLILSVFPQCGDFSLYSLAWMETENRHWRDWSHRHFPAEADPDFSPGDLDPQLAILIGDLGNGWDQPIALDYRETWDDPRVLLFRWRLEGRGNRWVQIAPNIAAFAARLCL